LPRIAELMIGDPEMADLRPIEPGRQRVVLVVVAHADDVALFIGGTVAMWSSLGWRVVVVRVTNDGWDSVGMSESATIEANATELRRAAEVLGVAEIVELGLPTDTLADTSEVALREKLIRQVRQHRPYALVTFDPDAMHGEDNQDHHMVAAATDEAFWTSQFDQHHPEHLAEGLGPHGCFERWYFGRHVVDPTHVVDITSTLDRKVEAACQHVTMMTNFANQLVMQARTGGWDLPLAEAVVATGDVRALVDLLVRAGAGITGTSHGVEAGEEFRIVTFGGMGLLLDMFGERRE
jgi:LmbE family N-acetylglucosaminyl deacetylase